MAQSVSEDYSLVLADEIDSGREVARVDVLF
jgi:hypothetical protein